ncbi:hypothetical protein DACRYDRAFT_14289 [Dacryopinax primogenitus]|uniref:RNA-dependent RNA polymerase n=1 Tax=Dacryopinax primogenitus (strain DJM 731) TaxID=1858805 RepID=M5GCW5_DACPD|nr:uncharacterized protein DACRYDRAFT_14289 [Dacryopinax primogenitus]EJU04097.1 hypothetical protein DACRYDRAFT_14289 [Dacryopinax primogenitus]
MDLVSDCGTPLLTSVSQLSDLSSPPLTPPHTTADRHLKHALSTDDEPFLDDESPHAIKRRKIATRQSASDDNIQLWAEPLITTESGSVPDTFIDAFSTHRINDYAHEKGLLNEHEIFDASNANVLDVAADDGHTCDPARDSSSREATYCQATSTKPENSIQCIKPDPVEDTINEAKSGNSIQIISPIVTGTPKFAFDNRNLTGRVQSRDSASGITQSDDPPTYPPNVSNKLDGISAPVFASSTEIMLWKKEHMDEEWNAASRVPPQVKQDVLHYDQLHSLPFIGTPASKGAQDAGDISPGFTDCSAETRPHTNISPTTHEISHHSDVLEMFEEYNVAFGGQWELARLQSLKLFKWEDLLRPRCGERWLPNVTLFTGSCKDIGPKILRLVKDKVARWNKPSDTSMDTYRDEAFSHERQVKSPWGELDKEDDALEKQDKSSNKHEGMGCFSQSSDVFHGKIRFGISVTWTGRDTQLKLDPLEIDRFTRLTRRFGSRRLIRMKNVSSYPPNEFMKNFFLQKFVFMGRVYRSFFVKENTVFLIETNETHCGTKARDRFRLSLWEFVNWHNPLYCNQQQIMTKWAARFALMLSTTSPGVSIEPENIHFIPDEEPGKPQSHHVLTDGAGYLNGSAMLQICNRLKWGKVQAAVQARFGGAKGMFLLHPDLDFEGPPTIWLRPSQVKLKYAEDPEEWDPAMRILDVVKPPYLRSPARLSMETIVALADRQVSRSVILSYLRDGLLEQIQSLFDFQNASPLQQWLELSREGAVISARLKRSALGTARSKGLTREEDENELRTDDDLIEDQGEQRSSAWWPDEISGCPSTLEESALFALDSGFTLETCSYLRRKVGKILEQILTSHISKFKLVVPPSAEGFAIPSPIPSALKPGEIFLRMSRERVDSRTGMATDVVVGDVLIVRHPCKLPSDIQLVKAVDCPELRHWKDVIITSVDRSQPRSLLSKLAGGDYDGDTVVIYWDKDLIAGFKPASDECLDPPDRVKDCFEYSMGSVEDFLKTSGTLPEAEKMLEIQKRLLWSFTLPSPGKWSMYHDTLAYLEGLDDARSIFMAHVCAAFSAGRSLTGHYRFTTALDGAKSGLQVKPAVERAFQQALGRLYPPNWKMREERQKPFKPVKGREQPVLKPGFIMEQLVEEGSKLEKEHLAAFRARCEKVIVPPDGDPDLIEPYNSLLRLGHELGADVHLKIEKERGTNFPFDMAMRELGRLKADPRGGGGGGGWKMVKQEFYVC